MIRGIGAAIVTPFRNNKIDTDALTSIVKKQIEAGCHFIVPCGTTGESPTLSHEEHISVIQKTVSIAKGVIKVVAGTGSNNTAEAVALTIAAKEAGADAVLVVSPYYNKPTPNGLRDYYYQVASIGLPVILYDIPGRTSRGVPTDIILELAKEEVIAGIKWASGDFSQLMKIIANRPDGFSVLSGDDNLTFPLLTLGGDGVISVIANIIPKEVLLMANLVWGERWELAQKKHFELLPLMEAMFFETNPIPVKTALAMMHPEIITNDLRSPMCQMEAANRDKLERVLRERKLI